MKFKNSLTICLVAFGALLAGCNADSQQANSNQENASQESSNSPPKLSLHKPKTFSAAVQRLSQLHESLKADGEFPAPVTIDYVEVIHGTGASGHSHFYSAAEYETNKNSDKHDGYPGEHHEEDEKIEHRSVEVDLRTELTDITRWLPKIAAKSDLNEASWKSVDSISNRLSEMIGEIAADASDVSFRESWKLESEEIETMLCELQVFVDSSGAAQ